MFNKCILVLSCFFSLTAWSKASWKLDIELVKPLYFSFDLNSTASITLGNCQLKIVDTYWGAPSCYSSAGIAYNGMTHLYKGAPGTTAELPYAIDSEDHYSPELDHTPMVPRLNGNESIITNCDASSLINTGYFREAKPPIIIPTDSNGSEANKVKADEIKNINQMDWYLESQNLTQFVYPSGLTPADRKYCRIINRETNIVEQNDFDPEAIPLLGKEYIEKAEGIAERQLALGGLRLATLINSIAEKSLLLPNLKSASKVMEDSMLKDPASIGKRTPSSQKKKWKLSDDQCLHD